MTNIMHTQPLRSESQRRDRSDLDELNRRASRYRTECGCAMGGAFLVAALIAWVWHVIADGRFDPGHLVRQVLVGAVFVIACSFAGKVIGVGVGRLRYIVIRRRIRRLRETEASPCPHVPVG